MKKILLLTFLSFILATEITTREITISIDSSVEELNMVDYFDLGQGYYAVELVYADLVSFDCEIYDSWGLSLTGMNYELGSKKKISISAEYDDYDGTVLDGLNISNANTTFSYENPILKHSNEGWNLIYGDCSNISVTTTFHITGNFESDSMNSFGDLNDDGDVNIFDVLVLVNVILDDDLGDIFDVIGLINKV